MIDLQQFHRKSYLNLETFRKSGVGVKTPVWFVQDGERLYVMTGADSGKVKRIRNNGRVNVAPCKMDGTPTGIWVPGNAGEITDAEIAKRIDRLLDKKYGLMKKLFGLGSTRQGRQDAILEIELTE
jgi:PPOX class probable F420-dependent enzyme